MIRKITISMLLFLMVTAMFSQKIVKKEVINQLDKNGLPHGVWKKKHRNGNTRYVGKFEHGKEVGLFKFYAITGESRPVVIKSFTKGSDRVKVQFFSKRGTLASEGYMLNKKREGLWTYYTANGKEILSTEEYKKGALDGEQKVFYKANVLAKFAHYKNGKLHGNRKVYAKNGKILEEFTYKQGVIHGPSATYDGEGVLLTKGSYEDGFKVGIWEFNMDGEMVRTSDPNKIIKD